MASFISDSLMNETCERPRLQFVGECRIARANDCAAYRI
jgi:hypothetical protein